jgi:hypothetical protein
MSSRYILAIKGGLGGIKFGHNLDDISCFWHATMFEKILKDYELKRALTFFIASSLSLQVLHGLDFVQLRYMYAFFG